MNNYSTYSKGFKRLLESKSGNIKTLLKESDMDFTDQPHFSEMGEEWNEGDEMGIDQPHFSEMGEQEDEDVFSDSEDTFDIEEKQRKYEELSLKFSNILNDLEIVAQEFESLADETDSVLSGFDETDDLFYDDAYNELEEITISSRHYHDMAYDFIRSLY